MKRMVVAVLGAVMISAVGMYAQAKPAVKPAAGSVYRGCLVPGSASETVMLINATEKGQKGKDKANYSVAAASDKVNVNQFVGKEVEISGTASGTGGKAVITATKIKVRSDYCG